MDYPPRFRTRPALPCIAAVVLVAAAAAGSLPAADSEFFESRIRPVLVEYCYSCHNSADTAEGELAVDFRDGLRNGGSGGALIVPGDPAASRLIAILKHQIEGLEMPEDSGKLDDAVIADFEKWIADGATDPRDQPPPADEIMQVTSWAATLQRRKQWWSFQPIQPTAVPSGDGNPIDRFIRAGLQKAGLTHSPPADPEVLIRRLYFSLIGLPPTTEELQHWMDRYARSADPGDTNRSPAAVPPQAVWSHSTTTEALIDHLLQSDQFGPRWARHWMDWIRYAESHGSEGDPLMKNAWMYRDYLIRALNNDVPYDQLVREHLAGDLLDQPRINNTLGLNESLLGTIQLRMVFHGFSPTDALDEKVRFVDDQVNTVSKAFLGLTVSCARCHDHKFDAISQADFYAMFGIFAACRPGRSIADTPQRLTKHRAELAGLKPMIRSAVAGHWLDSTTGLADLIRQRIDGEVPPDSLLSLLKDWHDSGNTTSVTDAWRAWVAASQQRSDLQSDVVRGWDLSQAADLAQWNQAGTPAAAEPPGQFAVALSGDQVIQGVYPGGVYSHTLSTRHPLRITSPDILLEGKYDAWVRAIGDRDAQTRFVAQDYPRTGTVFPATKLTPTWTWHKLQLDYWAGDSVHFELATGPDIPLQASDKSQSWFGVSDVRVVQHGAAMPTNGWDFAPAITAAADQPPTDLQTAIATVVAAIDRAVSAWQDDDCSNPQAHLIDHCLQIGLLDNHLDTIAGVRQWVQQYRKLEQEIPTPLRVPGLEDVPARTQPLYVRGNHKQPADIVPRRFLTAIDETPYPTSESGRRQLAADILRDDNPLSRRVIVNRIWHHLFGIGIVATPDNFGRLGAQPTHPELLDYLANRFVDDGWSLKSLIRMIVSSQTWQQSSQAVAQARQIDPDNTLLSRANVRRLEAEAIRDAMLRACGDINLDIQGPPVDAKSNRRSVFMQVKRNALDPMLRAFDFPEPHTAVGRRDVTNVPAQSLLMMNSPLVGRYATRLARQILDDASLSSDRERVDSLYLRALSRTPTDEETTALLEHLQQNKTALTDLRRERDATQTTLDQVRAKIDAIIEPKRAELALQQDARPRRLTVQPLASWEFDDGLRDSAGRLDGQMVDGATVVDGQLVVNDGGYGTTKPLTRTIKEKTLEAWVRLDNLTQRGGGVITIQTTNGAVFDSIVFAEKRPYAWLAGSDGFRRTQEFAGAPDETDAGERLVHVAISYHDDGTVVGYRDGQRYGKSYQTSPPVEYREGQAVISFGVRHFPNTGNHRLAGRIERANLYDRALSDQEVSESFGYWSDQTSDLTVIESLTAADRDRVTEYRGMADRLERLIDALGPLPEVADEQQGWVDLARTMFMLKEFIYVR